MKSARFIAVCWVMVIAALTANAADPTYLVKYVSAEHVYLSGGMADGLHVGDRLSVSGSAGCKAELEVVFVADHSASCKVLTSGCAVSVGGTARLTFSRPSDTAKVAIDTTVRPVQIDTTAHRDTTVARYSKASLAQVSGSFGLLVYWWNDAGPGNLDFTQTTARLNMTARHLFDRDITLTIRSRGRYDARQRAYNSQVSQNAWENKLWELSIRYDQPGAPLNAWAGRILPKRIGSIGYLDGLLVEGRMSDQISVGLLAGSDPQWWYDRGRTSITKAGGYVTFANGDPGQTNTEQTIALVGEYHGGTTSRELLALQGRVNLGSRFGLYHTAEIDLYRGWRKELTGKSLALSSLYAGGYGRIGSRVRVSLSYDNRTNVRTYETRSVADSLFDDHLRHGLRTTLEVSLPLKLQTQLGYGIHKRNGDPGASATYSGSLTKLSVLRATTMAMLQFTAFDGPFEHGNNYSARVSDNLSAKIWASLAYGRYSYTADISNEHRTSSYTEIWTQADLSRRYWTSASVQYNTGDDIDGLRIQCEFGCRF